MKIGKFVCKPKELGNHLTNNGKIPGNLLEKWNFVSPEKWKPCNKQTLVGRKEYRTLPIMSLV